jgi:UDP-2,3-diacylglucosamine pyrophosphatase LpxH
MERTALIFDVHAPYHDKNAYYLALAYISKLKPKVDRIVLAGDFVDFHKISFWKGDPDKMSFKDEVAAANDLLKELRQMFYRVPIDYIEGNHEQRLFRYIQEKAGHLAFRNRIDDVLSLKHRRIKYVSNIARICDGKDAYKLGKLYVLHGHEKKVSFGAINLARLFYLRCKTNVIAGHHHKSDYSLVRKLDGQHEGAWTVGTLGQLAEPYSPINDWNHGFAYVDTFDNGDFEVHNKIILEVKGGGNRIVNG